MKNSLKGSELKQNLKQLSLENLENLTSDWLIWARDDQLPPPLEITPWNIWLLLGGRGAGKTRAGAEWVRAMALGKTPFSKRPATRIALVGETLGDVRRTMIEGVSGLLNIHPDRERPEFEPSKRRLTWPNGAIAEMFSSEDPDALRGPQFMVAWCDELCKWSNAEATWDMLQFALRLGENPRQVVTTTPRPTTLLRRLIAEKSTIVSKSKTEDNAVYLSDQFIKTVTAIWGTIVTALSTILPIFGPFIGLDITSDMIEQLGKTVTDLIQILGGLTGTSMALYGRSRAQGSLTRRKLKVKI